MNLVKKLTCFSHSKTYWLIYISGALVLLCAALFFQYVLDNPPCVLCIQVRMWIALFVIVCLTALFSLNNKFLNFAAQLAVIFIAGALVERSYQLLGTERGFLFSDCGFDVGLPGWFALEEWLPWLFRVETSCGYTPEILFGITMAESLMALSVLLMIASFCVFLLSFVRVKDHA